MKTSASLAALAAIATVLGAAPAAWANIPAQPGPAWKAEELWIRDAQRRLQRRVDHDTPIRGAWVSEIRFDVAPDGAVQEPSLAASSGSPTVDSVALEAVQEVRALKPPPATLAGRPVLFRLVVAPRRPVFPSRR